MKEFIAVVALVLLGFVIFNFTMGSGENSMKNKADGYFTDMTTQMDAQFNSEIPEP